MSKYKSSMQTVSEMGKKKFDEECNNILSNGEDWIIDTSSLNTNTDEYLKTEIGTRYSVIFTLCVEILENKKSKEVK